MRVAIVLAICTLTTSHEKMLLDAVLSVVPAKLQSQLYRPCY
jgi:hypothetical protein